MSVSAALRLSLSRVGFCWSRTRIAHPRLLHPARAFWQYVAIMITLPNTIWAINRSNWITRLRQIYGLRRDDLRGPLGRPLGWSWRDLAIRLNEIILFRLPRSTLDLPLRCYPASIWLRPAARGRRDRINPIFLRRELLGFDTWFSGHASLPRL